MGLEGKRGFERELWCGEEKIEVWFIDGFVYYVGIKKKRYLWY